MIDEILNTTETSSGNKKKKKKEKNNCLIHTISLVIMCLLLLFVVSISCYYSHTRHWKKQKHFFLFHVRNNKFNEVLY